MIFDSHVHYSLSPILERWQDAYKSAVTAGVKKCMNVGTSLQTSILVTQQAKQTNQIQDAELANSMVSCVGIHPTEAWSENEFHQMQQLKELAQQNPEIVKAIGECGLDFHPKHEGAPSPDQQRERFEAHLQLATELQLPVIIHCRNAHAVVFEVLASIQDRPDCIMHCMSGSLLDLEQALRLGGWVSYAGNITYNSANNLRELVQHTPLERMLVETDAPFLAPQSHRGKSNISEYIQETVQCIAQQKGMTAPQIQEATYTNACKVFKVR